LLKTYETNGVRQAIGADQEIGLHPVTHVILGYQKSCLAQCGAPQFHANDSGGVVDQRRVAIGKRYERHGCQSVVCGLMGGLVDGHARNAARVCGRALIANFRGNARRSRRRRLML
jgi:hypothetical protein